MNISEKIYLTRTQLGMTQKEFAKLIGVTQAAVNYWENGKRTPNFEQITKIAAAIGGEFLTEILDDKQTFKQIAFEEDKPLFNYLDNLGYHLTLGDNETYILTHNKKNYIIPTEIISKILVEIDDYSVYRLESVLKHTEKQK